MTDARARELIDFARDLVRIQSPSGGEEGVVRLIADRMRALGYDEVRIDGFGNVLGRIGGGPTTILLDSHVDNVGVPDAELWKYPPYEGVLADGKLWGRGSVDMKSAAAASIYGAVEARERGLLAGKTVLVSCTCVEEDCDGVNLRHMFAEFGLRPDFCIICEPSHNVIVHGHKGKAQIVISTRGVSAHGSAPEKGVNAIYLMADIIKRVGARNLELARNPPPRPTLVMSRISSVAASLNAVPSECEVYLDRRMVPGETEATIRAEMDAIVAGTGAEWRIGTLHRKTWTGLDVVYEPLHEPWRIAPDHHLARAFDAAYRDSFGRDPDFYDFWDFGTNAVTPVSMGIPTIGFGPGEYKLAHMRDEHCAMAEIVDACGFYANAIARI